MGAVNQAERQQLAGLTVGVYGSGGAPWHHLAFAALHGASVRVVRAEDIETGQLAEVDILIFPGGGATAMAGLLGPLGEAGANRVRSWVEDGGTYLSSCAGSVLPLTLAGEADAALPIARCLRMVDVPLANPGDATLGGLSSPGVGRIYLRVDGSHPIARGVEEATELVHYNGPLFDLHGAPAGVRAFAWPTGITSGFTPAEQFMAESEGAEEDTTIRNCISSSAATALEAPYGKGHVVLFGSHPEFGLGPLCLGWGEGSRLLLNALGTASRRESSVSADTRPWRFRPTRAGVFTSELASEVVAELQRAAERFSTLADRDTGGWLEHGFAPSFHGRTPSVAWSEQCHASAEAAQSAAADLASMAPALGNEVRPWLDDEPRPYQDFGAMGLTQMLQRVHERLEKAEDALLQPARKPAHAYDLFDEHPFHLAVGSYLSAAGLIAGSLLTVAVVASLADHGLPESEKLLWSDAGPFASTANSSGSATS